MSHEIRTPMNAVIGMTTIAKSATDIQRKDYALQKIEEASKLLLGVVNDVLDMSKIEANKLELSPVEFDFARVVQRVIDVVNVKFEEKRLQLNVNFDEAIPHCLVGDDQRLAQVITNLLGNAVKFTPEGGSVTLGVELVPAEAGAAGAAEAETAGADEPCTIRVEVRDTGIGISEEQRKRLFTSFGQAESSTSRTYGGTGLGLAISKRIVEMMDGTIGVDSTLGEGSAFWFIIRLERGAEKGDADDTDTVDSVDSVGSVGATDAAGTMRAAETGAGVGSFKGKRILLAEDVEVNREIVYALLEPTQIEIESAENGVEALGMFTQDPERYDLIFMDVQMPEMNGLEATRRIRALKLPQAQTIPIVAMTASVFREDIEKCLAAGMNDHIGKPLDFSEVIKKLRLYLNA
jgi:CheY-like chemotaxis protein